MLLPLKHHSTEPRWESQHPTRTAAVTQALIYRASFTGAGGPQSFPWSESRLGNCEWPSGREGKAITPSLVGPAAKREYNCMSPPPPKDRHSLGPGRGWEEEGGMYTKMHSTGWKIRLVIFFCYRRFNPEDSHKKNNQMESTINPNPRQLNAVQTKLTASS